MKPRILLVHPGTQYSFFLARELARIGYLGLFVTGVALINSGLTVQLMNRFLPARFNKAISNRVIENFLPEQLLCIPGPEILALLKLRAGCDSWSVFHQRNHTFQQRLNKNFLEEFDAVIGFDTSSWILAQRCQEKSIPFILDRSQADVREFSAILKKINQQYPDWVIDEKTRPEALLEYEQIELDLAKKINVASTFSKNTLMAHGAPDKKIHLNPYGVDIGKFKPVIRKAEQPIRFLYVGALSVRKGLPDLLKVWSSLQDVNATLSLVGPATRDISDRVKKLPGVTHLGKIPHSELSGVYNNHDVFIFPSYFDGFALVLLEAMACGLPVITTTSTAGPDLVRNGIEGFICAPGDVRCLEQSMRYFLSNRGSIFLMGKSARLRAEQFTWQQYGQRWKSLIDEVLNC